MGQQEIACMQQEAAISGAATDHQSKGTIMSSALAADKNISGGAPTASCRSTWVGMARVVKGVAEGVIAAACAMWVLFWFFSPEPEADDDNLSNNTRSRFFRTDGREGFALIYQVLPFVIVAILSFVVIGLRAFIRSNQTTSNMKVQQRLRFSSLASYPLWVHSPLGILTVADVLFIIGVLFVTFYHFGRVIDLLFEQIDNGTAMHHHGPIVSKPWKRVNNVAFYFGTIAIIPFALLWVPVSRGSPLLRLIGLPFEHAVRYHIWLAVLMMVFVTVHSVGYIVFYMNTGQTALITGWVTRNEKCSVIAGLVAWIAGLVMWITSLSFFRRRWYEFFFGVHHLYIVYALFWLYHAVWNYHFFVIPILLFVVDRFLRMFQSRPLVDVMLAKVLESGAIELRLARNSQDGFVFHALSTWCIQIPSLSKIQWHFFSATSTPTKDDKDLSIVIKPLGAWTTKLHNQLKASTHAKPYSPASCPFSFKARVEGPYGDESDFYLEYDNLILVAGGIGVTPLLAILRDILHRHKTTQDKSLNLPRSIEVYHCVRTPEELCVLNEIDPNQILPNYNTLGLNIQVHAFITSKVMEQYVNRLAPHVNTGKNVVLDLARYGGSNPRSSIRYASPTLISTKPQAGVASIACVGNTMWVALVTFSSLVGYFVLSGLANLYIVKAYSTVYSFSNYNRAHVVVVCMLLGIFLFGGIVIFIWSIHVKKQKGNASLVLPKGNMSTTNTPSQHYPGGQQDDVFDNEANNIGSEGGSPWNGDLHLGCRPNWKEVFNHLSIQYKGQIVGVLVSGSQSMQEDVASECRRHSTFLLPVTPTSVAFEFHSVSFDL